MPALYVVEGDVLHSMLSCSDPVGLGNGEGALLLGAAFLAIGLWAWKEKGVLSNLSSITDLGGFDPVWLFIVVGGVMFILGFAGCIGALRENTFLLKFFSVFLGLIFFLELTAGILAFVFKDWIKDQLNFFINNNWSCCGAHGPDDWNLNIYFNCTDLNPSRERCGVPFSCCVKDPAEDVINTQCGYDVRHKVLVPGRKRGRAGDVGRGAAQLRPRAEIALEDIYRQNNIVFPACLGLFLRLPVASISSKELERQKHIYTKGCVGQFEKWLQDNLIFVAGIFVGIALLQIFGICLAQNLV
ncbi:unnamed protein product, partial [Tetraodon nigroviridis]